MRNTSERVKKHKNYLFVNRGTDAAPDWIRVKTSTDFAIAFNAETETFDYIDDENPTDEIKSYKPVIAQTQTAYIGDFVFDYVFDYAYDLKAGTSAKTQGILVFQQKGEAAGANKAWKFNMTITIDTYDVVAGTLTYTIGINGTIDRGEAVVDEAGVPVFTPDNRAA